MLERRDTADTEARGGGCRDFACEARCLRSPLPDSSRARLCFLRLRRRTGGSKSVAPFRDGLRKRSPYMALLLQAKPLHPRLSSRFSYRLSACPIVILLGALNLPDTWRFTLKRARGNRVSFKRVSESKGTRNDARARPVRPDLASGRAVAPPGLGLLLMFPVGPSLRPSPTAKSWPPLRGFVVSSKIDKPHFFGCAAAAP
jgi:hypothetical protein